MGLFSLDLSDTTEGAVDAAITNLELWQKNKNCDYLLDIANGYIEKAITRQEGTEDGVC